MHVGICYLKQLLLQLSLIQLGLQVVSYLLYSNSSAHGVLELLLFRKQVFLQQP